MDSQMAARVERLNSLPAIPDVMIRLNQIAKDPQASADQYEGCISHEPSLAAKVIRTANSAIFCPPGGVVRTLRHAIVLLGNRTLRGLALAFGVHEGFATRRMNSAIDRNALWTHSLATAAGSRILAVLTKGSDPNETFVAGLLHDIGILVMDVVDAEAIGRAINMGDRKRMSLIDAEAKLGGPTHADWGMAATTRWYLPDMVINAAGYHHTPWKDRETTDSTGIVHAACSLAWTAGLGLTPHMPAPEMAWEVQESLGLPDAQLDEIVKAMVSETTVAKESFGMAA